MVREIEHEDFSKKYIIPNRRASSGKKELNVQADIKTRNGRKLKVKALVDSGCTHTGIDEQLVKEKKIQTKAIEQKQSTSLLKYSMQTGPRTER